MARKRNSSIGLWLTKEELAVLKNNISKTSFNQSTYIRKCILNKEIKVIPGIKELIIELKRIGKNLNQVARAVNEGSLKIINDDLKDIKYDLSKVWNLFYHLGEKVLLIPHQNQKIHTALITSGKNQNHNYLGL